MKLYVYDHCPFCIKVRMIFGLKNITVELIFLSNDDEKTPISFIGKKMLPILQKKDGSYMPESMDIINYIDLDNPIINKEIKSSELAVFLEETFQVASNLLRPRFIKYPFAEFKTQSAIAYFKNKKQTYPDEFEKNLLNTSVYLNKLYYHLNELEPLVKSSNAFNGVLTYDDFNLFPLLRNLTIVKDIKFPKKINDYINIMSDLTKIPLLTKNSI